MYINVTPNTLSVVALADGHAPLTNTQQWSTHTASLSGRSGQPLCWSEAENNCAPQTQLCAFTDSHCVAGSNTCTYFSMVSLASTTRSLSAHMSCVLLQSESGNQGAKERERVQHVNTALWPLQTSSYFKSVWSSQLSWRTREHSEKVQNVLGAFNSFAPWRRQTFHSRPLRSGDSKAVRSNWQITRFIFWNEQKH